MVTCPYFTVLCSCWSRPDSQRLVQVGSEGMLVSVLMHGKKLMNQSVNVMK